METDFGHHFKNILIKSSVYFLAFFWTFSVSGGIILGSKTVSHFLPLMQSATSGTMSIVKLFLINCFPLIYSIIAIRFMVSFLILPLALFKGFCYGFLLSSVFLAFESAGWLVGMLFFLSHSIINVLLLWFWFKRFKIPNGSLFRDILVYTSATACVLTIDALAISPFLSAIISHY